jgi:hypothetical protein
MIRRLLVSEAEASVYPRELNAVVLVFLVTQLALLAWLGRQRAHLQKLPRWYLFANTVLESVFTTALLLILLSGGTLGAIQAITAPALLLYGVFVTLSSLYLDVRLPILAGILNGFLYGALLILARSSMSDATEAIPPASLHAFYPLMLLIGGIASAFVAAKARAFVLSSIEIATRHARAHAEINAAAKIQTSLMPQNTVALSGFEIQGWNRPADETGGDYFDVVRLDDDRVAACIADVSGHGLGPAMVTAFCRAYARSSLRSVGRLAEAMRGLNANLYIDLQGAHFITFAVVLLTPDEPEAEMLAAGHGPTLIYRAATDDVEVRLADTVPLGILSDLECPPSPRIKLGDEDIVLFITDGFFEWANAAGERWGIEPLVDAFRHAARHAPDDVIGFLVHEAERFANGAAQDDDLTALMVRRRRDESCATTATAECAKAGRRARVGGV